MSKLSRGFHFKIHKLWQIVSYNSSLWHLYIFRLLFLLWFNLSQRKAFIWKKTEIVKSIAKFHPFVRFGNLQFLHWHFSKLWPVCVFKNWFDLNLLRINSKIRYKIVLVGKSFIFIFSKKLVLFPNLVLFSPV